MSYHSAPRSAFPVPMVVRPAAKRVVFRLSNGTVIAALVASALLAAQSIIDPSIENIYCTVLTIVSTAVTVLYVLQPRNRREFPLSTTAVIGYNVTTHSLALVAQTVGWRSLIYNLQWPVDTFNLTIGTQAIVLAAHWIYTRTALFHAVGRRIKVHVLMPLAVFRTPGQVELWFLGFLGLAGTWATKTVYAGPIEYGDSGGKFLQALGVFQIAPAFILFRGAFADRPVANNRLTPIFLALYFILILATSAALNSRGAFAEILFDILLAAAVTAALGRLRVAKATWRKLVLGLVLALPLVPIVGDFSTAMIFVRNERASLSPGELISATLQAFGDKAALASVDTDEGLLSGAFYSEYYIDSPFLQRLTYTKYTDLELNASKRLSPYQVQSIRQNFSDGVVSALPTPILRLIGSNLDKEDLAFSGGDLYDSLAYGTDLAGFKTGSSIVNSSDILGYALIPGMIGIFCFVFTLLDTLSLRTAAGTILSPLAFLALYRTFTHACVADSLRVIVDQLGRGYVQSLFLYVVLLTVARIAAAAFPGQPRVR